MYANWCFSSASFNYVLSQYNSLAGSVMFSIRKKFKESQAYVFKAITRKFRSGK
jgi:hypothetical protein